MSSPKVTICMVVKNEETWILQALKSVASFADEWILIDTGSTDRTLQIAQSFSSKVKVFQEVWQDNFAHFRNLAIERSSGDWIMMLDGDEVLEETSCTGLEAFFKQFPRPLCAYQIWQYNQLQNRHQSFRRPIIRIFPNREHFRFHGLVHEYLYHREGERFEVSLLEEVTVVNHVGERRSPNQKWRYLIEKSLDKPDYRTPYMFYHWACLLLEEGQLSEALVAFEQALRDTLQDIESPPSPLWIGAPLSFTCVHVFQILMQQKKYGEIVERFPIYEPLCHHSELIYFYASALGLLGQYEQVDAYIDLCYSTSYTPLSPHAGYTTWLPEYLRMSVAYKQKDWKKLRASAQVLRGYFPQGILPNGFNFLDKVP